MNNPYYYSWERPKLRERVMNIYSSLYGIHGGPEMKELREKVYRIMYDPYNSHNRDERLKERVMLIINHDRTPNLEIVNDRSKAYETPAGGRGTKNYNINKIKFFKDIPDGIEILIDYIDVAAIRTMNIPSEIIYESIYRELPELFEE